MRTVLMRHPRSGRTREVAPDAVAYHERVGWTRVDTTPKTPAPAAGPAPSPAPKPAPKKEEAD